MKSHCFTLTLALVATTLATVAPACGGSDPNGSQPGNAGGCYNDDDTDSPVCIEGIGEGYTIEAWRMTCEGNGHTYYADGCPAATKGTCRLSHGEPAESLTFYYGIQPASDFQFACEASSGEYSSSTP